MGAAGRAIGPDGKALKQQEAKNGAKKGGVQQRNQGKNQNTRNNQGNQRFGGAAPKRFENAPNRGGPPGPRPLMGGHGGPMSGPGRPLGGPGGPMGGPMTPPMGRPAGPPGGPMAGRTPGMMGIGQPRPDPLQMQAMRLFQGSVPDPTGSYGGFFGGNKMNDSGSGSAPPVQHPAPRKDIHPVAAVQAMKQAPTPLMGAAKPTEQQASSSVHVGEVPGFGTNSSIHELFGKMVWRKMEQLRDQGVIDDLQNKIMNLIHDALAAQNAPPVPALNRGAFLHGPRRF